MWKSWVCWWHLMTTTQNHNKDDLTLNCHHSYQYHLVTHVLWSCLYFITVSWFSLLTSLSSTVLQAGSNSVARLCLLWLAPTVTDCWAPVDMKTTITLQLSTEKTCSKNVVFKDMKCIKTLTNTNGINWFMIKVRSKAWRHQKTVKSSEEKEK